MSNCKKLDIEEINILISEDNDKLKEELKCMKEELKAVQDGECLSCESLNDEEKRRQMLYLEEINILSLQLRETFETMTKIEKVNKQMTKELLKVRNQYRKLREDLKTQMQLDDYTFKQIDRALEERQAGRLDVCKCKDANNEEERKEQATEDTKVEVEAEDKNTEVEAEAEEAQPTEE